MRPQVGAEVYHKDLGQGYLGQGYIVSLCNDKNFCQCNFERGELRYFVVPVAFLEILKNGKGFFYTKYGPTCVLRSTTTQVIPRRETT